MTKYGGIYKAKNGIILSESNGIKKQIMEKVKQWLTEENYQFNQIEDPNSYFHFQLQNPNVSIYSGKSEIDSMTLATFIRFPKLDKQMFSFIAIEGKKFFWNLQNALNQLNVSYSLYPNIESIERVDINKKIYFDGLTKNTVFNVLLDINRAITCVNLQYQWLSENGFNEKKNG
jgi:hypothetical protein